MLKIFCIIVILTLRVLLFFKIKIISQNLQSLSMYKSSNKSKQNIKNQPEESDNTFFFQTDAFKLLVSLNEKELSIELFDYPNQKCYQGTYQMYGGKTVHQFSQVILKSIFSVFQIAAGKSDQTAYCQFTRETQLIKYKFGEWVTNGNTKCYKVEPEGKITLNMQSHPSVKKENIITLNLQQKRNFTQTEKWAEMLNKERRQNYRNRTKLQTQNIQLKGQINKMKEQLNHILEKLNPMAEVFPYVGYFKFQLNNNNKVIQYIGINQCWTQYIASNTTIPYNQPFKFKVRIIKTSARYIMIGVIDQQKQKNSRNSQSSGNVVYYYGCNGHKYPEVIAQGSGFSAGEIVETTVNLSNKTITWSVSGSVRATHTHIILGDQSIKFKPYIQFYSTGDTIQMIS